MKINRTLLWVLGGHLAALLLLYLPFAFRPLPGLEIIAPGIYNIILIAVDFFAALLVTAAPGTRKYAAAWWLGFGLLLLLSFPACLATLQISKMLNH
ncbi:MAG: hypothetical protein ACXU8O_04960 [Asticcacaulis sp.]